MKGFFVALALLALLLRSEGSAASPPEVRPCARDASAKPSDSRRALGVAAAVFPGVIVTGTGHWVTGQPCTARRLLAAEGVGVAGMGVGIPALWLSGASRYLAAPAALMTLGGFGLILPAIGADIYGASGAAHNPGLPEERRPRWAMEFGMIRVYNPLLDFGWVVSNSAQVNVERMHLSGGIDTAVDGLHARYRLAAARRLLGPLPDVAAPDGSYLDLELTLGEQRYTGLRFVSDSADLELAGRFDLGRFGPSLRGSFSEWSAGLQLSRTRYLLEGFAVESDQETMLLARFGFGVYLGRSERRGSEVEFYYDHRRDDYAAGLKLPGLANGMVGHVGLEGSYYLASRWGVRALLESGSSHVAQLSLLFRSGGGS